MAIIRKYGRLSIFLIFTTNPRWNKITYKLLPRQTATDRPNLVIRVFCIKLIHLFYDLKWK